MTPSQGLWELLRKAAEHEKPANFSTYFELRRLLAGGNATDRAEFRRLFTSYFVLNVGGLTEAFKEKYFELLFACRPAGHRDPYTSLLRELYHFPRRKGDFVIHASFVTKLVAIHDDSRPLFDIHVHRFFGRGVPPLGPLDLRIAGFVSNLCLIQADYDSWAKDKRFRPIADTLCDREPRLRRSHPTRLCDFLVWTVGARRLA